LPGRVASREVASSTHILGKVPTFRIAQATRC
jgi:hypothetical protein